MLLDDTTCRLFNDNVVRIKHTNNVRTMKKIVVKAFIFSKKIKFQKKNFFFYNTILNDSFYKTTNDDLISMEFYARCGI
jgi:hypothetical protein